MSNVRVLKGHTGPLGQLRLCPDGRRAVTAGHDGAVRIWDIGTGDCLQVLEGHREMISRLVLHPDGKRLISTSRDRTIRLWDLDAGKCLGIIPMTERRRPDDFITDDFILHPDGKRLVTWNTCGSRIKLWDIEALECVRTFNDHTDNVREAFFHPDGQQLISWVEFGEGDSVRVWDLGSGTCLRSLADCITVVEGAALSADARLLLIWNRAADFDEAFPRQADPRGLIWDLEAGRPVAWLDGHKNIILSIEGLADGRLLSRGADDTVRIWDDKGQSLRTLTHDHYVGSVWSHPDGNRLFVHSWKEIYLWDIEKSALIRTFKGHTDESYGGRIIPHSNIGLMVSYSHKEICVWDIEAGRCLYVLNDLPGTIHDALPHPDGRRLITRGGDLRLYNLETGKCLEVMKEHKEYIGGFHLLPDGRFIVSWSSDGTACVWDIGT